MLTSDVNTWPTSPRMSAERSRMIHTSVGDCHPSDLLWLSGEPGTGLSSTLNQSELVPFPTPPPAGSAGRCGRVAACVGPWRLNGPSEGIWGPHASMCAPRPSRRPGRQLSRPLYAHCCASGPSRAFRRVLPVPVTAWKQAAGSRAWSCRATKVSTYGHPGPRPQCFT